LLNYLAAFSLAVILSEVEGIRLVPTPNPTPNLWSRIKIRIRSRRKKPESLLGDSGF
jgi:hypothetical protein